MMIIPLGITHTSTSDEKTLQLGSTIELPPLPSPTPACYASLVFSPTPAETIGLLRDRHRWFV